MNIEELSKSQLLLLTLLVNFVVAIATSIVTVSLLQDAPPIITQTVNRIVERTVETIVPDSPSQTVVTREQTVIVKEEDLVISAVAAAQSRTVLLKKEKPDAATLAVGTFLPRARAVVVLGDARAIGERPLVVFANGTSAEATLLRTVSGVSLYTFANEATLPDVATFSLMPAKNIRAGQSVFAIAADGSVATGIISLANADRITTTLPAIPAGSQVVNTAGDVIGLAGTSAGSIVSADAVAAVLAEPAAQ